MIEEDNVKVTSVLLHENVSRMRVTVDGAVEEDHLAVHLLNAVAQFGSVNARLDKVLTIRDKLPFSVLHHQCSRGS